MFQQRQDAGSHCTNWLLQAEDWVSINILKQYYHIYFGFLIFFLKKIFASGRENVNRFQLKVKNLFTGQHIAFLCRLSAIASNCLLLFVLINFKHRLTSEHRHWLRDCRGTYLGTCSAKLTSFDKPCNLVVPIVCLLAASFVQLLQELPTISNVRVYSCS